MNELFTNGRMRAQVVRVAFLDRDEDATLSLLRRTMTLIRQRAGQTLDIGSGLFIMMRQKPEDCRSVQSSSLHAAN